MQNGKEITTEEVGINEGGEKAYYLSKKLPLKNKFGEIIGIIGTSIDISKQKKLDKLKEEFSQNVMHDIRTPFVGILGVAELLWHKETDSEKKEYLNGLMECAKKLLDYNNEILDFSKYDSNTSEKTLKTKFNYKQIVDEVIKMNISATKIKNIKLDANLPIKNNILFGDPTLFKKILINLVGNAIKFTESGYIKIIITFERSNNNAALVKLVIKDSGIGIPKDKQEVIFDKFVRLNESHKGLYTGLGLGLTIVKKLVEVMQGTIEVESDPGKGSTFTCKLPVEEVPGETLEEVKDISQSLSEKRSFKVLLVEDEKLCQLIISEYVALLGFDVDIANCGNQALELFETNNYDLVLMDAGLPDLTGHEVTAVIRAKEQSRDLKPIPIIGLTAHTSEETKNNGLKSGMNIVLTKPITYLKLAEITAQFLNL